MSAIPFFPGKGRRGRQATIKSAVSVAASSCLSSHADLWIDGKPLDTDFMEENFNIVMVKAGDCAFPLIYHLRPSHYHSKLVRVWNNK